MIKHYNLTKSITVNNEKSLSEAISSKYGKIVLEGAVADTVAKEISKYRSKEKWRKRSEAGFFFGMLFWPLLLPSLVGLAVTKDDLKNYKIDLQEDRVILTHKKALLPVDSI
ncbi:MAG: hypothetical protein JXR88_14555 [Clostridia bacterium]|nr:hypothetical protein [Clostridia bacterium]